jgi:hypothetical protein
MSERGILQELVDRHPRLSAPSTGNFLLSFSKCSDSPSVIQGVTKFGAVVALLQKEDSPLSPLEENSMTQWKLTMLAVVAVTSLAVADDQEKKIKRADLPPAVEKTVAAVSQGATIKGFSEEVENGQTLYEAKMTVNGHGKDVNIDSSGAVVEVEEQVEMDSLPAAVKEGLQAKAGKGKIIKVESITKHDKLVAYEAQVGTDGKKSEVQVGPDGKPLDHEE